ncbi:HNH endonuclease [Arthrobacter sp. MYb229]|uniref:HNH endonuclease signature motif containing protein n=1 Tax=unclassified Arthrobacter TaxID=235627 RepID=UPI000CFDED0F|nr:MULTISPECIES: HNH endonuclease signature motif containing protein [unclassified Arthrobacter]PRA06042.1 HNH endonuclease [Arthrobacter sp. MYb229]PRB52944.1 HNH endonuclease [Arthrobacter sp. MYb216]
MFEEHNEDNKHFETQPPPRPPTPGVLNQPMPFIEDLNTRLATILEHGNQTTLTQTIDDLERLKASCSAAQAKLAYHYEKTVVRDHEDRGIHIDHSARGAAATIAINRRQTTHGACNYLTSCRILNEDTPHLAHAFEQGELTERQILAITAPLQEIDTNPRREFDALFATHPDMFNHLGPNAITDTVRKFTERYQSSEKAIQAEDEAAKRYIRFRKGKNCVMLSAKLPLIEGTALAKSITQRAKAIHRTGNDPRTKKQLQADMLICSQLNGFPPKIPLFLDVKLIMTDKALFLGDREPANLPGYGMLPAQYARELVAGARVDLEDPFHLSRHDDELNRRIFTFPEIQRIYTAPGNQDLIAMDSKAREFPESLKEFIRIRDAHCQTPYCNGVPEEIDHVVQHHLNGPTTVHNSSFRCSFCNKAKELPGWYEKVDPYLPHSIVIDTGDGRTYRSLAPPATGVVRDTTPPVIHLPKHQRE